MDMEKDKDKHALGGNGKPPSDEELLEEWINYIYALFTR